MPPSSAESLDEQVGAGPRAHVDGGEGAPGAPADPRRLANRRGGGRRRAATREAPKAGDGRQQRHPERDQAAAEPLEAQRLPALLLASSASGGSGLTATGLPTARSIGRSESESE